MANLFSGVKDPLIQGTGSITDYQTSAGERFASELEGAFDTNPLAQGARMARYAIEANAPFFGLESNMVSPEVAREELKSRGLEGHITVPEGGMSRVEFDSIQYLKQRELSRQAKSAMNQSTFAHIAGFAGGLVGSAVDPINIASAFVPIVPEARIASMLGKAGSSVLGRAAVRAQVGATEGVVGALMIEPFTYAMSQYEQMDYTPADSFMNVVFGGLLGGGLHMAGGAVYDWRATRALNSLQRGLDGMNLRDMAPDLQDEVQLDILRRFTEAEENGAPLPDADEIIAQRMTPDQRSAVQEADGMPGEVPTPTRADGQPSQPKGLDELIPEAKADRTAETFNRQFLDKEQGDVAGFSDVRPPREDIFEVAQANFVGRTQHTAKTVPIDQLSGGVSADTAEAKRVSNLVDLMSGPNGYLERLIVDTDGNVIEGQHRLEALRKMGVKEVPVIEIRELREGLPVDRMMDAMQQVRGLHRDQARQIIDQIAEAIADVGSVAEVRAQYAPPRGFERAWEAALNAAEAADDLKAQSAPAKDASGKFTEAFWRWFKDSKVVDEDGKPLVVHHGTPNGEFFEFEKGRPGTTTFIGIPVKTQRHGFFFAEDKAFSQSFAEQGGSRTGAVMSVYLSIKNPLRMTEIGVYWKDIDALVAQGVDRKWLEEHAGDLRTTWEAFDDEQGAWFVERIKQAGYDGVYFRELNEATDEPADVWVAFEPTQIKSATGNRGTYDPELADIRAQSDEAGAPIEGVTPEARARNLRRFMGGLPHVKDGADYQGGGAVFDAWHGTTHDITKFKKTGQIDNFLGLGPYFTTSRKDADANYAGEGPDLTLRISREEENVADSFHNDDYAAKEMLRDYLESIDSKKDVDDYDLDFLKDQYADKAIAFAARRAAKGENDGFLMKMYVKLENPADATGKSAPLTYEAKFDDNDDFVGESGTLLKWIEATREVADEFQAGPDAERYITALMEEGGDVDFKTVFDKTADFFDQVYDPDTGNSLGTGAMFREIAERAGYDGVIMDADRHFGSGRRGFGGSSVPSMEGVYPGTLHIVPFKPGNVKSAWGNRGTYDPELADIRAQSDIVDDAAAPNNGLTPYTQSLGGQTDVNQPQSPDVLGTQETGLRLLTGVRRSPGILPPSPAWSDTAPLAFLPTTVKVPGVGTIEAGAFPLARKTARDYVESTGRAYDPITTYRKVDPARAGRIAEAFEQMRHEPDNPEVKAAYEAMVKETLAQWEAVKRTGLVVEFIDISKGDPYAASPRLATEDVRNNNHLWVFATDDGFGTDGITAKDESDNPLFQIVPGEKISGKQVRANDIFRIVHDYFGHIKDGVGFRADGEENAWRSHSRMYSPLAARAMTTETRGQNSWLNYGPYGEKNRTALTQDTIFAEQKIGLLPDWVMWEGLDDLPIPVPEDRTLADELGFGNLKMMGEPLDPADGPDAPKVIGTDAAGRPVLDFRNSVVSHFTDQESADNINEFGYRVVGDGYYGEAISFTPDRAFGAQFGGVETTARISPDARILNTGVPEDAQIIQSVLNNRHLVPNNPRPGMRSWRQEFLRLGIDGVYDPGAGDLFIYNERVVRPTAMDGLDNLKTMIGGERAAPLQGFEQPSLLVHETRPGDVPSIAEHGLRASKPRGSAPSGIYLHSGFDTSDPRGDVPLIGVRRTAVGETVADPMFPRWALIAKQENISPDDLFLWNNKDDEWVPLRAQYDPDLADIRAQSDVDESGVVMDEDGGIEVWHGSPHDFDRFDMSKIGTGEGNQSFGRGLYFAEARAVGEEYREKLSAGARTGEGPGRIDYFLSNGKEVPVSDKRVADIAWMMKHYEIDPKSPDGEEWLSSEIGARGLPDSSRIKIAEYYNTDLQRRTVDGRLYKAKLKVKPEARIDWDAPLSDQPHVLDTLIDAFGGRAKLKEVYLHEERLAEQALANVPGAEDKFMSFRRTPEAKMANAVNSFDRAKARHFTSHKMDRFNGEWLVSAIGRDAVGAEILNKAGFKVIQYKDAGSRTAAAHIQLSVKGKPYGEPIPVPAKNQIDGLVREYQRKGFEVEIKDLGSRNYVVMDDELIDIIDKFQSDLDEQPDLVAAHNMTAANLLHADKMGGIAAPSLAIAKASDGHEGYGEITLIGSKDLVDPQKGANVYAGDIYSARYPTVHYNIKYDNIRKLEKKFAATAKELGVAVKETLDDDALEREGPRALENSVGALLAYAKEKGVKVDGYVFDYAAWEVRNREAQAKEQAIHREWRERSEAERERAQAEGRAPDDTALDEEMQPKYMAARREAGAILREPDRALDEIKYKLRDKFRNDSGFAEWAEGKFAELKAKERIFKGFSNTTGAKMYTAHTLDNVVKLMTKKIRDAEGFNYGIGNLRAKVAPKFRSVEAIRGRKGSLVKREEFDAIKKEADAELISIADQLLPKLKYKGNSFGQLDALTQHMAEAIDRNNVKRVFQEYYNNLTDDDVRMVGNFLQKLKTMPTTYFEAKLDRAVQIGEFEAAIVPNTLSKKAREVLERSGVKQIIEYDPAVDGSRQAAIDSIRDMKFQSDLMRDLGFFSAMEKSIKDADLKSGTGAQWLGYLKNRPGVKAEEMDNSGISDFLTENANEKLTKEQVLQHAKDNAVELEEVTLGTMTRDEVRPDQTAIDKHKAEWEAVSKEVGDLNVRLRDAQYARDFKAVEDIEFELAEAQAELNIVHRKMVDDTLTRTKFTGVDGPSKYSQYTLPGGQNYREVLLTLPGNDGVFKSSHFDQRNIVAHARISDRATESGRKAMHVEEIQSDWHQKGREKGYATKADFEKAQKLYSQVIKLQHKLIDEKDRIAKKLGYGSYSQYDYKKTPEQFVEYTRIASADDAYVKALDAVNKASEAYTASKKSEFSAPEAPFKKTWHELMLKRLIRMAVEKGYDEIVITRGQDIAERFDLSKQVSEIHYEKDADGSYEVRVFDKSDKEIYREDYVPKEKLKDIVGQELASKIINEEGKPVGNQAYRSWHSLSGLDLKVGGEGMKGFYDKIVVDFLNKYGKKYGAKVGTDMISVGIPENPNKPFTIIRTDRGFDVAHDGMRYEDFDTEAQAQAFIASKRDDVKAVHSFPITDAMRTEVMKGQMLFQRDVVDVNAKDTVVAGPYTYTKMDTERRQRSEALRDAIEDLITKYTGGRAQMRWYSSISQKAGGKIHKVDGGFSSLRGIIVMALDAADMVGSAKHEALHFLKDRGLISDVEWDTLVRTALREGWMDKKYGGSKLTVRQRYAHLPNMLDILEEAIAEQFRAGRYDNFQGFHPAIRPILIKLRKFFDAVAKEARKIFGMEATAEDIFRAIESGEIGRRADVEKAKVEAAAIMDAPQRSAPQQMKNQSTPEEDPLRVDRWAADDVAIAAEATDDSKRKDETLQDIEADTAILGAHLDSMRQRGLLSQEDEADLLASNDTARMMEEQAAAYEAAGICEGEE